MFLRDYQGRYISDLTLTTEDGPVPVYICRACQAITIEPFSHEQWHEGEQ